MPITTTNRKALNIVAGWGGGGASDAKAELLASAEVPQQRPNRLGLGAAATIKPAERGGDSGFDRAGAKLQAVVKKEQRKEQRAQADRRAEPARADANKAESDGESDDDGDAGRSAAFQPRAKPATAPSREAKPALAAAAKRKRADSPAAAQNPAAATARPAERKGAPRAAERARPSPAAAAAGSGGADAACETGAAVKKPRRTKTRSKQKSLRRDTRAEHLKPTYRTPGASDYVPPAPPAWKVLRPTGTAGADGDGEQ